MLWGKKKVFLEKVAFGSLVLYLICLAGYIIPASRGIWDGFHADILGFAFFLLFIASTILLDSEERQSAGSGAEPPRAAP